MHVHFGMDSSLNDRILTRLNESSFWTESHTFVKYKNTHLRLRLDASLRRTSTRFFDECVPNTVSKVVNLNLLAGVLKTADH